MNKDQKTNPVKEAALDFGGQSKMSTLLIRHGIQVHKQTVSQWCIHGFIPHKYRRGIEVLLKTYPGIVRDPQGLLACVRPHTPHNSMLAPNKELEAWFEARGGISDFVKKMNESIITQNEEGAKVAKERKERFTPRATWRYVQVHNWVKRGRISDDYRGMMESVFGCPRSIMGPEDKRNVPGAEGYDETDETPQVPIFRAGRSDIAVTAEVSLQSVLDDGATVITLEPEDILG